MEANQLHFLRLICEGNERVDLAGMEIKGGMEWSCLPSLFIAPFIEEFHSSNYGVNGYE